MSVPAGKGKASEVPVLGHIRATDGVCAHSIAVRIDCHVCGSPYDERLLRPFVRNERNAAFHGDTRPGRACNHYRTLVISACRSMYGVS